MQKHNFKGIKKLSSDTLRAFLILKLNSIGIGWILDNKFSKLVFDFFIQKFSNSLANQGLFLINTGMTNLKVDGQEKAMTETVSVFLKEIYDSDFNRKPLTIERTKEIDEKVIDSFRKFGVFV